MNAREEVLSTLEVLDESEIEQVAHFISFLKFRRRVQPFATNLDDRQLAALYAEAAEEDRALAEAGLADYEAALLKEDSAWDKVRLIRLLGSISVPALAEVESRMLFTLGIT